MQTLTPELLTAQQTPGQVPSVSVQAYYDKMAFTALASTTITPPAGYSIVATDSCIIKHTGGTAGILSVFLVYKSAGTPYIELLYRYVDSTHWGTAGYWNTYQALGGVTSGTCTPLAVSVSSDWTQNTTSEYATIGIEYTTLGGGGTYNIFNVYYQVIDGIVEGSPVSTVSSGTFSDTMTAGESQELSGWSGQGDVAALYDSVAGTGIIYMADFMQSSGYASSGEAGLGKWTMKYFPIGTSVFGTSGTCYTSTFPMLSSVSNIQAIERNGVYYGVVCGFEASTSTQRIMTFTHQSNQMSVLPFSVTGPKDVVSPNGENLYGPIYASLDVADMVFDLSIYPTTTSVFVLSYGYQGVGIAFTEMLCSADFLHWGGRKMVDPASARISHLFNLSSSYVQILDSNGDVANYTRNVISSDLSNNVSSFTIQDEPDMSPSTLDLTIANAGYVGANITKPLVIQKDAMIVASLGFNISLGRGVDPYYLSFNGTSAKVTVPVTGGSALQLQYPLTLSAWAYVSPSVSGSYVAILDQSGNENYELDYDVANSQFRFTLNKSGLSTVSTGVGSVTKGAWYHVCGTYDGTTQIIYLNGVQQATSSTTGQPLIDTQSLMIGARANGTGDRWWNGYIDDVRIYSIALTSTQVSHLYSGAQSFVSNLVGWWKFDEGSGTTALDASGNGFNGTIANATYAAFSPNETVQHGIYYIDTITQSTTVSDNKLEINCRDAFKKLSATQYLYQITIDTRLVYAYSGTGTDFSTNFNTLF